MTSKIYERITAENWAKGDGANPPRYPKVCLVTEMSHLFGQTWAISPENTRLVEAIRALYPERNYHGDYFPHVFNDHPDTTVEDVLRVLKFADV